MSKMGNSMLEMQEDAQTLSKAEFVKKHGQQAAEIYDTFWHAQEDAEPYYYPGSDPQE